MIELSFDFMVDPREMFAAIVVHEEVPRADYNMRMFGIRLWLFEVSVCFMWKND